MYSVFLFFLFFNSLILHASNQIKNVNLFLGIIILFRMIHVARTEFILLCKFENILVRLTK